MSPAIEARYLRIEWQSEGVARELEAAPVPLQLEPCEDGGFVVETSIFRDVHPWLGLRLRSTLARAKPVLLTPAGEAIPMLRIMEPRGGGFWWVLSHGWDKEGKRQLCELHRSAGTYEFRIGSQRLQVDNRLSSFGNADIKAYIEDFQGDLIWMLLGDGTGATTSGKGAGAGKELRQALDELQAAAQRVLASPSVTIREARALKPASEVRPIAASFREYVQNPATRLLTSRVFTESPDTPENRYVRHMLRVAKGVADAFASAASLRAHYLERLASEERERARNSRVTETRTVEPELFDRQTEDIRSKLAALEHVNDGSDSPASEDFGTFKIRLGGRYSNEPTFFYSPQPNSGRTEATADYRLVTMPPDVFKRLYAAHHFCRDFALTGAVTSTGPTINGKLVRRLAFTEVHKVVPSKDPLEKRAQMRARLEQDGWQVRLSGEDKHELQREADVSERVAERAERMRGDAVSLVDFVRRSSRRLDEVDSRLEALGVAYTAMFPTGMLFVSNPRYASTLRAFNKVRSLTEPGGFDLSKLDEIGRIGIIHASSIYEKWCLLKLFNLLVHEFRFKPEEGWEEKLVAASLAHANNVRITLTRQDVGMKAMLAWQPEMPTGRRPDFIITITQEDPREKEGSGTREDCKGDIVLDAKFRSAWKFSGPQGSLEELILAKGYNHATESGKVFILQPCNDTVSPPGSPLEWGRHCDYGGGNSHALGWVQTGVTSSGVRSTRHLKRLLAMVFQSVFPAPEEVHAEAGAHWTSQSFCVLCGERHFPSSIKARKTDRGISTWAFTCQSCSMRTSRNHCYKCRTALFKNGAAWTYHTTVAEQLTNVICPRPDCGSYFVNWSEILSPAVST